MLWFLLFFPCLLLWFVAMPPLLVPVWALIRVVYRCIGSKTGIELPFMLETPWDLLGWLSCFFFGVRIHDHDGQHTLLVPGIRTMRVAVLANHRSFGDFFVDPVMGHCAVVARLLAVVATLCAGVLGLACNRLSARPPCTTLAQRAGQSAPCDLCAHPRRTVVINRGKEGRQSVSDKCEKHDRFLFYPEGTRRAAQPNADEPVPLKVGGIKNLYEAQRKVLIVISVNKEVRRPRRPAVICRVPADRTPSFPLPQRIVNERTGAVRCGVTLYRARAGPIDPTDYGSFELFLEAVETAWRVTWQRAYDLRAANEGDGGRGEPAAAQQAHPRSSASLW